MLTMFVNKIVLFVLIVPLLLTEIVYSASFSSDFCVLEKLLRTKQEETMWFDSFDFK